jgi:ABC-type branched-subunit amino acid transport system substrate-binding protein
MSWSRVKAILRFSLPIAGAMLLLFGRHPAWAAEHGVTDTTILLGQSAPFSGPAASLGEQFSRGAQVFFNRVNAQGGVFGRKIVLIRKDDELVPERTQVNAKLLISQHDVFALFGFVGAPNSKVVLPIVAEEKVPFFAPYSGSDELRQPFNRYVFHVRASHTRELEKIVQQLVTIYASNVAVFYQYDSEGWAGMESVKRALKRFKLDPVAVGAVARNSTDVAAAVQAIAPKAPGAVIMICTYKSAAAFIKEMRRAGYRGQLTIVSSVGSQALLDEVGKNGYGVMVSQVVPFPWSPSSAIVMEYQKAMQQAGLSEFDFTSLEGFIAAKALVEGLQRAGKNLTREKFIAALESIHKFDLGDFLISFSPTDHGDAQYVDLTIIGASGKFRR